MNLKERSFGRGGRVFTTLPAFDFAVDSEARFV